MDLNNVYARDISASVNAGELSALEVAEIFIDKIERENKELNAFISIRMDEAVDFARGVDESEENGKLSGVPIAISDNIALIGEVMTCGSKMLENYRSPFTATVISKVRSEGGVVVGKTNMDEFGVCTIGAPSYFGPVRNPRGQEREAGGAQGGAAAAVASGQAVLAIGTDTGGSLRQPAALCGVVGFKPTYGAVSRHGVTSLANSMDTVGIVGRKVKDIALLFDVIAGFDEKDATTLETCHANGIEDVIMGQEPGVVNWGNIRVAIPSIVYDTEMDKEISSAFEYFVGRLVELGAHVEKVQVESFKYGLESYQVILNAELSSNLSRFDGMRFGYKARDYHSIDEMYTKSRTEAFGDEIKQRILLGTNILGLDIVEDYFIKAQKIRRWIWQDFNAIYNDFDFVLLPTTPFLPIGLDESLSLEDAYERERFTSLASLAGVPAISLPMLSGEWTVGIQVLAKQCGDDQLLRVSDALEGVLENEI